MMIKPTYVRLLAPGLLFLLAACGGSGAGPAPLEAEEPAVAEVVQPDTASATSNGLKEEVMPARDGAVEEAAMAGEVAAAQVETVSEETMAAGSQEVAVTEEQAMPAEMASEEAMAARPQEVAVTGEQTMPEEVMTQAGPTADQLKLLATLKPQGTPPELLNEVWLNSEPLKLADLHGQVVIVEFWTFGCINCVHVLPSLREWHQKYADDGLVIIGVHTPEFSYEKELENVKDALVRLDVPYPVAIDNDWQTWRSYHNHYWPAKYFIDKAGNIRHLAIGEGHYQEQEEIIQALLAEQVL